VPVQPDEGASSREAPPSPVKIFWGRKKATETEKTSEHSTRAAFKRRKEKSGAKGNAEQIQSDKECTGSSPKVHILAGEKPHGVKETSRIAGPALGAEKGVIQKKHLPNYSIGKGQITGHHSTQQKRGAITMARPAKVSVQVTV